jgi:hypothetical protein
MIEFAPPVAHDSFVYQGVLFVDEGSLNRHPRASVAERIGLLRPKIGQKAQRARGSSRSLVGSIIGALRTTTP